jgi:serine phosphatase RsbU (regulator of sigma subunit)
LCRVISVGLLHVCLLSSAALIYLSCFDIMAAEAQKDAAQLAEQVAKGFKALSGEYQILFEQQKQLESKLSWAKQQVSNTPVPNSPL